MDRVDEVYVEKRFPPAVTAPRAVRAWIRDVLHEAHLAPLEHSASLLVTELVTNAVLHAHTPITVTLETRGAALRMSVADTNPRLPVVRESGPDATTGRGLHLVEMLAQHWGLEEREGGKAVWCELVAPSGPESDWLSDSDQFLARHMASERTG